MSDNPQRKKQNPQRGSERSAPQYSSGSSNYRSTNMPRSDQQREQGSRGRGGNSNRPSQSTMRPSVNQNAPFPTPAPSPLDHQRHVQFNPVGAQDQENQIPQPMPPRQRSRNQSMPPNAERRASQFNPHAPEFFPAREMNAPPPPQMNQFYQQEPQGMHQHPQMMPQYPMQQSPMMQQQPQMMHQQPVQQDQLMQQQPHGMQQQPQVMQQHPQLMQQYPMQQPQIMQQPPMQHPQMVQYQFMMPPPQVPAPVVIPPPQLLQNPQVMPPHVVPDAAPQPPMPPPQLQMIQEQMQRDLDLFIDYMDDRLGGMCETLLRQQNQQMWAIQNLFMQQSHPDYQQPTGSAPSPPNHPDTLEDVETDAVDLNTTESQSFSDFLQKKTQQKSDKDVQTAPQVKESTAQTDPVEIVDECVDEPQGGLEQKPQTARSQFFFLKKSIKQADKTILQPKQRLEETASRSAPKQYGTSSQLPVKTDDSARVNESLQDDSKIEEDQLKAKEDKTLKKGQTGKSAKKANRARDEQESKKKIEKSDEDALAELDKYRSFANLLTSAINDYVKNEHDRRHTHLAFQNSERIVFSDDQQPIVDFWKRETLVGVHLKKRSPELNIQKRFDQIIQSCRQSGVPEDMNLAFFMQSLLDSTELIVEEDIIYFCHTEKSQKDLKAAMEAYCQMVLSYHGKEPAPIDLPCLIGDFANNELPFPETYLPCFVAHINISYTARFERKDGTLLPNIEDMLQGRTVKERSGWNQQNVAEITSFLIDVVERHPETEETKLFTQFYKFLTTIRSSIIDMDIFNYGKKIVQSIYSQTALKDHQKLFFECFGYNPN